jgi:hypothetical protein
MPEPQQQDFVTQFRAMPRDRQTALIGKMSPEQKQKLSAALKASPATTPPAAKKTATPEGWAGVYEDIGKGFVKGAGQTVASASKALHFGIEHSADILPGSKELKAGEKQLAEKVAPTTGTAALEKLSVPHGAAQMVGVAAENVAEYAAGEAALKTLSIALKAKDIATVARIVKQYPWLSKVGVAGMKAFVLGTTQAAAHGEEHPVRAGLETMATGMAGEGFAGAIEKRGVKAIPKTYEAVNEHIGLKKSDLPKWERMNAEDAHSIGKTVMEQGALKPSVEETHIAIEVARKKIQSQTDAIVANAKGRGVPIHADLQHINSKVAKHFVDMGRDINDATTNASNSIYNEFKGLTNPQMSVKGAFDLRKKIGAQIDWNNLNGTENVRQMFLGELYHTLNNDIERALPPEQAKQFASLNRTHNRLIIARQASGSKIVDEGIKGAKTSGVASRAATVAAHAAGGAVLGAVGGAEEGHAKEGAGIGAIAGGLIGARREIRIPHMDVKAEKLIAKAAPKLAAAARRSPALARAIESATAAHGGGTGSISAP